jgi:RNA polymerase sigma-70 factor (ECF subfamily)
MAMMDDFSENLEGVLPTGSPSGGTGRAMLFTSTLWSVVLRVGGESESESAAALERLCHQYWRPLHVFARRRGHSEHDAQDLTQGFLAELLAKGTLARAEPSRGRFRTFLLSAFCNYMANQRRDQAAQKRGGGMVITSLQDTAIDEPSRDVSDGLTPEHHFEQSWAMALLGNVLARLREEYVHAGRLKLFEALLPGLTGNPDRPGYAGLGSSIGLSEGTVAVAMHRMRRRYGELLRLEIAATVTSAEEVESELRHLLKIVSSTPKSACLL